MITITCALKTGGIYNHRYVEILKKSLDRIVNEDYHFICFTDTPKNTNGIFYAKLNSGLDTWWSKLACFSLKGPVLYFDLDTVFTSNIDELINAVKSCEQNEFLMLKPFKKEELWASGIMGWNGYHGYVLHQYSNMDAVKYRWDQRYISRKLLDNGIRIKSIQSTQSGIYSFKHHCREVLCKGASIVVFHGSPRPHEVVEKFPNSWIKGYWDD